MLTSPNVEGESQCLSLKEPLKHGSHSWKLGLSILWIVIIIIVSRLVFRIGSSFSLGPTLNTSPEPSWVEPPKKCCHVHIHVILDTTVEIARIDLKWLGTGTWDPCEPALIFESERWREYTETPQQGPFHNSWMRRSTFHLPCMVQNFHPHGWCPSRPYSTNGNTNCYIGTDEAVVFEN